MKPQKKKLYFYGLVQALIYAGLLRYGDRTGVMTHLFLRVYNTQIGNISSEAFGYARQFQSTRAARLLAGNRCARHA